MRIFLQRFLDFISLAAPSVVLVLMPKCPACIAGYMAVATGLGISVAVAANLRALLIVVCIAVPLLLIGKQIRCLTTPKENATR